MFQKYWNMSGIINQPFGNNSSPQKNKNAPNKHEHKHTAEFVCRISGPISPVALLDGLLSVLRNSKVSASSLGNWNPKHHKYWGLEVFGQVNSRGSLGGKYGDCLVFFLAGGAGVTVSCGFLRFSIISKWRIKVSGQLPIIFEHVWNFQHFHKIWTFPPLFDYQAIEKYKKTLKHL